MRLTPKCHYTELKGLNDWLTANNGDSNADWSGDLNDRKSNFHYLKFEGSGREVKTQATLAVTTAEAKVIYLRAYKKQSTYELY